MSTPVWLAALFGGKCEFFVELRKSVSFDIDKDFRIC